MSPSRGWRFGGGEVVGVPPGGVSLTEAQANKRSLDFESDGLTGAASVRFDTAEDFDDWSVWNRSGFTLNMYGPDGDPVAVPNNGKAWLQYRLGEGMSTVGGNIIDLSAPGDIGATTAADGFFRAIAFVDSAATRGLRLAQQVARNVISWITRAQEVGPLAGRDIRVYTEDALPGTDPGTARAGKLRVVLGVGNGADGSGSFELAARSVEGGGFGKSGGGEDVEEVVEVERLKVSKDTFAMPALVRLGTDAEAPTWGSGAYAPTTPGPTQYAWAGSFFARRDAQTPDEAQWFSLTGIGWVTPGGIAQITNDGGRALTAAEYCRRTLRFTNGDGGGGEIFTVPPIEGLWFFVENEGPYLIIKTEEGTREARCGHFETTLVKVQGGNAYAYPLPDTSPITLAFDEVSTHTLTDDETRHRLIVATGAGTGPYVIELAQYHEGFWHVVNRTDDDLQVKYAGGGGGPRVPVTGPYASGATVYGDGANVSGSAATI